MSASQNLAWFAGHELRLAWRDWAAIMAGGRTTREHLVTGIVLMFVVGLHWLAHAILSPVLKQGISNNIQSYVILTALLLTTFSMMLSQGIEHVTRAFYARADLDLILSSPAPARHLFSVRILSICLTGSLMTGLLAAPFINMAVILDGPRWLSAYAVIVALGALSTGLALAITMWLFRVLGAKRTRTIAQVIAAIVGAALLIAIQAVAVMTYGNLSRMEVLTSAELMSIVPAAESAVWIPARAVLGEPFAALCLLVAGVFVLVGAIVRYADRFSRHVVTAAGLSEEPEENAFRRQPYRAMTTAQALRAKEWALLGRDPWLVSQTLMQVLYLIPPALLLWRDLGSGMNIHVILTPVLVMAFGQLAGGLAWLAISGEDAPDLVATAPVSIAAITRAKVEAVLAAIMVGCAPFLVGMTFLSMQGAVATAAGICAASVSAIVIQLWFKSTAKRSQFRRRQVASRAATFSEAFSSIFWAGAAGFAAAGSLFAVPFALLAILVLPVTWWIRPRS